MADTKVFTEANRKYFNDMAETYNTKPWQLKIQTQIFGFIRQNPEFIGVTSKSPEASTKLLDYACGTGMITRALEPYVTSVTGIDLSTNMVSKFNSTVDSSFGKAIEGNLITNEPSPELEKEELYDFDIAAIGLGFHHFSDPSLAMRKLAERVKKGTGIILIIDWLPDDKSAAAGQGHGHGHGHGNSSEDAHGHHHGHFHSQSGTGKGGPETTIRTHGFSEEDMQGLFEQAGCDDFRFTTMEERVVLLFGEEEKRVEKTVFMARGKRA